MNPPTLRDACQQGFERLDALTAALARLVEPAPWLEDLIAQVADLRDLFDAALTADDRTLPTAEERAALAAAAQDELIVAAHATWSALDEQRSRDARVMSPRLRQAQDQLGAAVRAAKGIDW